MNARWLQHYEPGVRHQIDVRRHAHLWVMLADSVARYGKQTAFVHGSRHLSFADVAAQATHFAAYLQQVVQLRRGDRIALMLPNTLQYPVLWLGAVQAGCVVVNISPFAGQAEAAYRLHDSGAQLMVVADTVGLEVIQALRHAPVRQVLRTGSGGEPPHFWGSHMAEWLKHPLEWQLQTESLRDIPDISQALRQGQTCVFQAPNLQAEDLAVLQYSDGATGRPKAVEITHGNLLANLHQTEEWVKNTLQAGVETFAVALPFSYLFSLNLNMLLGLRLGARQVLIEHLHRTEAVAGALARHPVSVFFGINDLFRQLLQQKALAGVDFSTWKMVVSGGVALQRSVAEHWYRQTGTVIVEAYGLAEAASGVCAHPLHLRLNNGSVGVPLPNTRVEIRDEFGRVLPPGEVGELWVEGPQVMRGYWMRPEETAAILDKQDYLATGDVAMMDEQGFIHIKGRRSDLIRVHGQIVYPDEVEHAVLELSGVVAAACVAVPDGAGGDAVRLYVVRSGSMPSAATVRAHCHHHLAAHQQPADIVFCQRLPQSASGKLRRAELRQAPTAV